MLASQEILKKTEAGEVARDGYSLAIRGKALRRNTYAGTSLGWERPSWALKNILKPTEHGHVARQGENLALPVTNISMMVKEKETTLGWTKPVWATGEQKLKPVGATEKSLLWTKPDWTRNSGLKPTQTGVKMVERRTLEKPITFPHGKN